MNLARKPVPVEDVLDRKRLIEVLLAAGVYSDFEKNRAFADKVAARLEPLLTELLTRVQHDAAQDLIEQLSFAVPPTPRNLRHVADVAEAYGVDLGSDDEGDDDDDEV